MKGYVSLVRSSVLDMLSGARQKEMKIEPALLTAVKVILGVGVLGAGYYCAVKTGDIDSPTCMPWPRLSWSLLVLTFSTEA